ncbi:hypothetical protein [Kitasatospora sp. NPDC002965]|uniref:hypothetical protein n=1 Tax=Kitasatospora sp. NPDC002965 TaxID=3154775 RepID=UPI00339F0A6E
MTEPNEGRTPMTVRVVAGSAEFDAVARMGAPGGAGHHRNDGVPQRVPRILID